MAVISVVFWSSAGLFPPFPQWIRPNIHSKGNIPCHSIPWTHSRQEETWSGVWLSSCWRKITSGPRCLNLMGIARGCSNQTRLAAALYVFFFSLCVWLVCTGTHESVLQNGFACLWVSMDVLAFPTNPPIERMLHLGCHRVTSLGCIHSLVAHPGSWRGLELVWTHPDVLVPGFQQFGVCCPWSSDTGALFCRGALSVVCGCL